MNFYYKISFVSLKLSFTVDTIHNKYANNLFIRIKSMPFALKELDEVKEFAKSQGIVLLMITPSEMIH